MKLTAAAAIIVTIIVTVAFVIVVPTSHDTGMVGVLVVGKSIRDDGSAVHLSSPQRLGRSTAR
ncbi:MAG: hypothetical protein ACREBZ_02835 [Thermoplasmata archaeon]